MRARPFRDPTTILTVLALLALPALAWLQVRWIDDVSTTARDRVNRTAVNAGAGVARDLEFELGRAFPWNTPRAIDAAAQPAGISAEDTFVLDADAAGRLRLREWLPGNRGCADRAWPEGSDDLRLLAERHFGAHPRPRVVELAAALDRVTPTHIVYGIPLAGGSASPPTAVPPCDAAGDALLLVRVNLERVTASLVPMLIARHFGDAQTSEFNVAVVDREEPSRVVARGPGTFDPGPVTASPDLTVPLPVLRADEPGVWDPRDPRREPSEAAARAESRARADAAPWRLVAQHRLGSLDAAVGRIRVRNLALAGAVLVVLACAVLAIAISARRARRLSRQQIAFVAAVSHELRSPVAAIDLAAQNLEAGVVTDAARMLKYGRTIRAEAQRLGATVERVLQFASISAGQASLSREPVHVAAWIGDVAARARRRFPQATIDVSCDVPADAVVVGDPTALDSCVENLVANAVKYSGASPRVAVQARVDRQGPAPGALVRVEDEGPGIAPEDRGHLFEPFRRGTEAVARRVPGNGLGLYVVRHLIEAHGGRVDFEPGQRSGAAFTLWLPLLETGPGATGEDLTRGSVH